MDRNSTLGELAHFARNEKKLCKEAGLAEERKGPKKSTVENILQFSRTYSNRPSKYLGRLEMMLN
jgi:hypothetical protein